MLFKWTKLKVFPFCLTHRTWFYESRFSDFHCCFWGRGALDMGCSTCVVSSFSCLDLSPWLSHVDLGSRSFYSSFCSVLLQRWQASTRHICRPQKNNRMSDLYFHMPGLQTSTDRKSLQERESFGLNLCDQTRQTQILASFFFSLFLWLSTTMQRRKLGFMATSYFFFFLTTINSARYCETCI